MRDEGREAATACSARQDSQSLFSNHQILIHIIDYGMGYMTSLQSLWTEAKSYLELQKEYVKLDTAEKLSVLLSAVATAAVCLFLALSALVFLVIAIALWLAKVVGGAWSFTIMSGVLIVAIVVILLARKRWIVQPVTRFVAALFVSEDEEEDAL